MILHMKLRGNAIFMQAVKKIEGLLFECCYTCMLWICISGKICTNLTEKQYYKMLYFSYIYIHTHSIEIERSLKARISEDFCVHKAA